MRNYHLAISTVVMIVAHAPTSAFASDMVYHPVIPAFGGNPLNGSALLATAQAQGEGVRSGQQGPDLSGLNDALRGIGGAGTIIIGGAGGANGGGNNMPTPMPSVRATVP